MGFSHSWNGTILTITSDSGTSSADLKGDIGIRGPQGPAGSITGEVGDVDLSNYYTRSETDIAIETAINNLDISETDINLSNYYTKLETDRAIGTAISNLDIPAEVDLSNYYTKLETNTQINNAISDISEDIPEVKVSNINKNFWVGGNDYVNKNGCRIEVIKTKKDGTFTSNVTEIWDGFSVRIGANGNWFIGAEDTGVPASGNGSGGNVELDTTLSEEGKAADSKAVGDAISTLSYEIAALRGENSGGEVTTMEVAVTEYLNGGYIRADGTLNSSTASFSIYGPIALKAGDKVRFTAAGVTNASAILARANGNTDKPYNVVITATADSEVQEFEYEVAVSGNYYISSIRSKAPVSSVSVTTGQTQGSSGETIVNNVAVSEYLNGGYIRSEGTLNNSTASFSIYGPIALTVGNTVRFTAAGYSNAVAILALATGNTNKPYNPVVISEDGETHEFVYTVAVSGDYYISSIRSKAPVSSVEVIIKEQIEDSEEKTNLPLYCYAVSKVLCIGDSLTNGAYYVGDAKGSPITQSYPYYLGRMLNCETTNAGNNGASASDWYNRHINNYTYSEYDTFIIWLGTNYGCSIMPTDEEIAAFIPNSSDTAINANQALYLIKIIQTIQAANASSHIVLCTIFASNTDIQANNNVVTQIAEKYGCQLVDMSDLTASNNIELHAGIKNVHFGKVGNIYIANRLVNEINEYIAKDPIKGEFGITFR